MSTDTVSPLRQRIIEDMNARKLCATTRTGHIRSCKRFAAFLSRSPDTATLEDIRLFVLLSGHRTVLPLIQERSVPRTDSLKSILPTT